MFFVRNKEKVFIYTMDPHFYVGRAGNPWLMS